MPPGAREPPALLVYNRGRWHRLPPGCVYAVARRGRLKELNAGTVRAALRRFQMRLPSKVRLGPRLSYKKIPPEGAENTENEDILLESKQINIQKENIQPSRRKRDTTSSDAQIQSITTVATIHAPEQSKTSKNHQLHRSRLLSSESKSSSSRIDLKKLTKEIEDLKSPKKSSKTDSIKQKTKEIVLESPKKTMTSRNLDSPQKRLSLKRKPVEQTSSSKQSSPILKSKDLSENQILRYLQPTRGKQNKSPKKINTHLSDSDFETDKSEIFKPKDKKISNLRLGSNQSQNISKSKISTGVYKIGPKRLKLDQNISSKTSGPQKANNIFQSPADRLQKQYPTIGPCKELEIDEKDIEIVRIFLQNHYSDRELLKFDADDEYKKMIFFRINPLVNIEWCPIIDKMLRRSQDSQISLADFASKLGLQSIVEAASNTKKRYKIRKRTEKNYVDSDTDTSSEDMENKVKITRNKDRSKILKERVHNTRESNTGETAKESKDKVSNKNILNRKRVKHNSDESDSEVSDTKENNKERSAKNRTRYNDNKVDSASEESNAKLQNNKAKKQTKRGESYTKSNRNQKEKDNTVDTVELSSESEKEKENDKATSNIKKSVKTKPVISSKRRRTNLEYSGLEDQAIVAWVSTGSRASRVNGNLLWRQLQDQYLQITGNRRTWHSLRNRYLRYILPKLGSLALPLSQQTRLRAAAATGELKARKARSPRRNSIFTLPPRGAASRKPAASVDTDNDDHDQDVQSRSPRYSSLTRQFSRRRNLARPSSERSDNSERSNRTPVLDTGTDKSNSKGNPLKKTHVSIVKKSHHKQINSESTRSEHSDSDRRSESPRRDKDSSDSSSESEDVSKKTYESLRTRRSINDSNKRQSRSDMKKIINEVKPKLTRQSNIRYESDESKSKSPNVTNKHKSERNNTNESPRRKMSRHKSPSGHSSSDSSESVSQVRRKSPEANKRRSRRQSKTRDELNESKRRRSPNKSMSNLPIRNSNKHKSLREQGSKGSNTSMSQVRHKSPDTKRRRSRRQTKTEDESKRRKSTSQSPEPNLKRQDSPSEESFKSSNASIIQVRRKSKSRIKRKNTHHDSSSEESDSSSESVSRRKSNRIKTPKDSNRRKSNRVISSIKLNGRTSSTSPRRKSNRLTPNESSNKRRHSSESKRKSKIAKYDSLAEIVVSDSSESNEFEPKRTNKDLKADLPKRRVGQPKMRRLFNPQAIL